MWAVALAAMQVGRRGYVWVSLAVVAAGLALWRPLLLYDTGFQLSVVGTAGIVLFTPWCERPLHRLPPLLRESAAVTLAAQLATLPITALGFGQLSLVGPLANGLLLPLLGPIMLAGAVVASLGALALALGGPLGAAGVGLAQLLAWLLYPLLAGFIWAVRGLAALPHAAIAWPAVPLAFVGCYYALLGVTARLLRAHGVEPASTSSPGGPLALLAGRYRLLSLALLLGCLACSLWSARPRARPTLWIEGVAGGPILLVQGSGGRLALIDGGSDTSAVQALLERHLPFWSRDLGAVLVSQPDRTHLAGLGGLTSLYHVEQAWDAGAIYPSAAYARWRAELRDAGVARRQALAGRVLALGGTARIEVLLPAALSLDGDPAPVAYFADVGGLEVLLLNRQATGVDPPALRASAGPCLDVLVLPARADPAGAAALARALRPALLVLPPPTGSNSQPSPRPADLAALPVGTRAWVANPGAELRLDGDARTCAQGKPHAHDARR